MPVSGPFFSPGADTMVDAGVKRIERAVAKVAWARVQILMKAFFRNPRPFYWTQVIFRPRRDFHVVTDQAVVYGHWLEGTGSRNQDTRFKGYRHFRTTTQSMRNQQTITYITDPVVTDLCRGLNG
jgi:hypothetical protein